MKKRIGCVVAKQEQGIRLEHFLRKEMQLTKNEISRAKFLEGGICVNGQRRKVNALLEAGDLVEVLLESGDKASKEIEASREGITILYEDEDVLVADKPSGLRVHPNGEIGADTLANRLAFYLREKGEDSVIRIFGRLDKDTSGVVLAVKNRGAAVRLQQQREAGLLSKRYLAVVEGIPDPKRGRIDKSLGPVPEKRNRMCVDAKGKPAVTYYETLSVYDSERRALLRLRLETGRTHQIRVHMASIGCPLLGDPIYGNGPVPQMGRTALHAQKIYFRQPFTGEAIKVEAEVPKDIVALFPKYPFMTETHLEE